MDTPKLTLSGPVPDSVRSLVLARMRELDRQITQMQDELTALKPLTGADWPDEGSLVDQMVRLYLATGSATKVAAALRSAGVKIPGRRNDVRSVMPADVQALVAGRACDVKGKPAAWLAEVLRRRAAAVAKKRAWSA